MGELLTTDPMVDMVSFTGSTAVGRRIMAAASDTVKKVFLELGGKSAYIVLDDFDMAVACMVSGFTITSHAGQGCAITTRMLVPLTKFDEAVEHLTSTLAGVQVGDPSDPATMMGPLINARQWDKVDGYVQRAVAAGAKVATGGRRPENLPNGYFYEPTVLVDVDPNSAIAQEEVFGPVLALIPYKDDDDAVAIANNSIFGSVRDGQRHGSRPRAVRRPPHPRRHHQRQRWALVRPRLAVRRLQAVGHRPRDGCPGPARVPGDEDAGRTGQLTRCQMMPSARSSASRRSSRPSTSLYTGSLSAPSPRPRWSTRPGVPVSCASGACTVTVPKSGSFTSTNAPRARRCSSASNCCAS